MTEAEKFQDDWAQDNADLDRCWKSASFLQSTFQLLQSEGRLALITAP